MTETKKIHTCSFCGSHKEDVEKLIVGDAVAICSDCVDLCNQLMLSKEDQKDSTSTEYDAYAIKEHLDKHVIGQDDAKRVLSVAIANHYKRITHTKNKEIQKGNVLFIGPTGAGKTLLTKTVAKYLNVPFVIADATNLTEAGYVGEDVESMISMLLSYANNDIELAERGIVFIDEIDKIARKSESASITRDVSGEGVQQALLKIIEGTKCRVHAGGKRKHPHAEMVEVDTKNILFIAGGSFVGLENIIDSRKIKASLGFGAELRGTETVSIKNVTSDDLVRFGMIPELIGRFTTTVTLTSLTVDELIEVLINVKNSFIDQYQFLFSVDNVELSFTDQAIKQIAQNCIDMKTGARGLQTEIERVLMPHMFHANQYAKNGITELIITHDLVQTPRPLFDTKK